MFPLLLAFAISPSAPAATAMTAPAPVAAPAEAKAEDEVVCRRETVIGSRVQKRRVCMSEKERARLQQGTRDGVDDYLRKSTGGATPGG